MKDEIVSFEVAKLAKEKGFNEVCFAAYRKGVSPPELWDTGCVKQILSDHYVLAPTQSLLQRWLREKFQTHIYIEPSTAGLEWFYFRKPIPYCGSFMYSKDNYSTYEQALEEGLKEALKLI